MGGHPHEINLLKILLTRKIKTHTKYYLSTMMIHVMLLITHEGIKGCLAPTLIQPPITPLNHYFFGTIFLFCTTSTIISISFS